MSGVNRWEVGNRLYKVIKARQKFERLEYVDWDCCAPEEYYIALARLRDLEKQLRKQYKKLAVQPTQKEQEHVEAEIEDLEAGSGAGGAGGSGEPVYPNASNGSQ